MMRIGVDIGGTKVVAGVVDGDGRVRSRVRADTPAQDPARLREVVTAMVRELAGSHPVQTVGVGAAGLVDAHRAVVTFAPNIAWRHEPVAAWLRRDTGLPVVVENDANAAAWAEARFGAARGEDGVVTLTVGTGIGGGIVTGGRLQRGSNGVAAELGHLVVAPEGRRCGCGARGCWEAYASGNALVAHARELARESPGSARTLLDLVGGRPESIRGRDVTRAADLGDPAAVAAFRVLGIWLARGMANISAVLDPGTFVLGGGVAAAGALVVEPAVEHLRDLLARSAARPVPDVRVAALGDDAGLIGAADLAVPTAEPIPDPRGVPAPRLAAADLQPTVDVFG
ncbi:MAG: ROK family glucokinase [Actinomycetota bacterium]|nr:ROK family glucokinase [Actinomycetota bacterium]